MKKYVANLVALMILTLSLFGCGGAGSNTTTADSGDSIKTATVTIKADFGEDGINAAFLSDIDNITIKYRAGCANTMNLFEYYYVDNHTDELAVSTPIFLKQFYESLYDLYVKTKLAELDNTTLPNEYYNPKFDWQVLGNEPITCAVENEISLTPDNNSVTLQLPTGDAGFKVYYYIDGRGAADIASTAGTLVEGHNNIVISSLRGTWVITDENGSTLGPQIIEAVDAGVKSINKLHLSRNFYNMRIDMGDALAQMLLDNVYDDPEYYNNMDNYYTQIAQQYANTNVYKTNYEYPFSTSYYGGIYEVSFDNGTYSKIEPVPGLFNMTQGFIGGTADNASWNGFSQYDGLELELSNGKFYSAFIIGFKVDIAADNGTVNGFSMEPVTTVAGDNMQGWFLESLGANMSETCYLKTGSGWVNLSSCEPFDNMIVSASNLKDSLIKAFEPNINAAALYPAQDGCIDNITNSWTDLDYYNALCYDSANGKVYWPNYTTSGPSCDVGNLIYGAYIKIEATENIEKACMQQFKATRQPNFDLSGIISNVNVNIN